MKELSLHIMDLAENGIAAGAGLITVTVNESVKENLLEITVQDNGSGVSEEMLSRMTDPFVTTRTTRRVGMGLSMFKAAAERCDGRFEIYSEPGKGTRVFASFVYNHIDRAPLGDMASSITALIAGYHEIDIDYTHIYDDREFVFTTGDIRQELEGIPLNEPAVIQHLKHSIRDEIIKIQTLE